MRKLVIFLLIIVLAVVVVDFLARALAERRIADAMQAELDLAEDPSVGIDAFPFTLALLDGTFPEVSVSAEGVGAGEVDFERTQITFEDVEFSAGQLLSGERRSVRIGSARGSGTLTAAELSEALEEAGVSATVEFRNGLAVVSSDEFEGEVRGELAVEDGALVITPADASELPEIALPEFSRGLRYEGVEIRGQRAILRFRLNRTRFVF